MNNIELQKTWVQGRPVVVDNLLGTAFTGEAGAHTFKIRGVDAAQEAVTISGTITGKLLAANNVTISLSGSIEDGCAVVTLTDECYDVPGRFIFSVYATSGSTTLCLYCAVGNVLRTDSQVIAYPTESLPNITSLMADLEQILADWPTDYSQLQSDVSSLKSAFSELTNDVDELQTDSLYFEKHIDGVISNPAFELGDIYINGSGVKTYYNSTSRARILKDTDITLQSGTVIGLRDYNGYRYILYLDNGDNTYTSPTGGWKQTDFTIETTGKYLILLSYLPEATITNLSALVNLLRIRYDSTFDKLVEGLSDLDEANQQIAIINNRKNAIDYVNGINLELGDLYVNSSGQGTYYNSTSRLRTIHNNPLALKQGDVLALINYPTAVFIVFKKTNNLYQAIKTWNNNECLIQEDGEYEALVRYETESTITDVQTLSNAFVIKRFYGIVRESTNVQNITDVYKTELAETIQSATAKTTNRALMYGIITDTHLDATRVGYYNQTLENLERLNNMLHFNGIIHLGDIINGYNPANIAKYQLEYAMNGLLKIAPGKTYVVVGNHDNNNGAGDAERLDDTELYSIIERFNETNVHRSMALTDSVYENAGSNYYVDYDNFKIRAIFFDSCYYSGGFPDGMITWMSNLLSNTPSDYNFVFFTHESTEAALNGGNALGNATTFKNLLAQYKDRIYCYIHGHSHCDYVGYDNEFAQIALCCAVPDQPPQSAPSGAVVPTRTVGTATQDCISIVIILPDEEKVEIVRFGAGDDMTVPFRTL